MAKLKSSIPGMPYLSTRDQLPKSGYGFMKGRQKDDGAEGLWRIHDNLYDLEKFIKNHPGGSEWLECTRGTDITEAFEAHHISDKAERLLPKFFVRKAVQPRIMPYTFHPKGFYRTFRQRAWEALKGIDFHNPSSQSKRIADFFFTATILSAIAGAFFKSWFFIVICAISLNCNIIVAHNFFHMRDNFRMYYFDLCLMSSKEWRISHALSHHLYPNTMWDMEISIIEPFLGYLPRKDKTLLYGLWTIISSPVIFSLSFIFQGLKRYYTIFMEWKKPEFRDILPFVLPTLMSFFAPSLFDAIKVWLAVTILSSLLFHFIGLTAAHHHPEIFHDGDVCREDLDWGLMELDAVRDRTIIDDSLLLVLTNFGSHGLHHLLPTVDHAYLNLCLPAFIQTCEEFGVGCEKFTSWELIKGQYKQLLRNEPALNYRRSKDSGAKK